MPEYCPRLLYIAHLTNPGHLECPPLPVPVSPVLSLHQSDSQTWSRGTPTTANQDGDKQRRIPRGSHISIFKQELKISLDDGAGDQTITKWRCPANVSALLGGDRVVCFAGM